MAAILSRPQCVNITSLSLRLSCGCPNGSGAIPMKKHNLTNSHEDERPLLQTCFNRGLDMDENSHPWLYVGASLVTVLTAYPWVSNWVNPLSSRLYGRRNTDDLLKTNFLHENCCILSMFLWTKWFIQTLRNLEDTKYGIRADRNLTGVYELPERCHHFNTQYRGYETSCDLMQDVLRFR